MKFQFDANQTFQLDAVAAVADLFDDQPRGVLEFSVLAMGEWEELYAGHDWSELDIGNQLLLPSDRLRANVRAIQHRNDIYSCDLAAQLEAWDLFDAAANTARTCPHFHVEMATGTGPEAEWEMLLFKNKEQINYLDVFAVNNSKKSYVGMSGSNSPCSEDAFLPGGCFLAMACSFTFSCNSSCTSCHFATGMGHCAQFSA